MVGIIQMSEREKEKEKERNEEKWRMKKRNKNKVNYACVKSKKMIGL